jgi:hypothetical protein
MPLFVPNSEITIGTFQFSGVHQVRIKRSLFGIAVQAWITIPAKAVLLKKGNTIAEEKSVGDCFKYRDKVVIKLGYDNDLVTEFEGFVKRCDTNMPVTVECEGYIQQLRLNGIKSQYLPHTTAKKLLQLATEGTDVEVIVQDDLPFTGVRLNYDPTAEDVVREIRRVSNNILNVFFIEDKKLWCGLLYGPMSNGVDPFKLGTVDYRIGWNVPHNNSLRRRVLEGEPVIIRGVTTKTNGEKIQTASQAKSAARREKSVFNNIGDKAVMSKLVQEKQVAVNYQGYEGSLTSFLHPYSKPGYMANIVNTQYPADDGKYLVTATEVTFGIHGGRREVEIGPVLGFNANK